MDSDGRPRADRDRPGVGIWAAWSLALTGGLSVIVAAALVVGGSDACGPDGTCVGAPSTLATALTLGGTALAVLGGLAATWLTIRRRAPDA